MNICFPASNREHPRRSQGLCPTSFSPPPWAQALASATGADRVAAMESLSLSEWQTRLASHFEALAKRRTAAGWPVFALEHGLLPEEVHRLERAIGASLLAGQPRRPEYLAWVVYAAEFGYRYAGDQYWQSFAAETRGWNDRWREFIRNSFERFAERYHGAQPEGAWAANFTIISWPITHGVLPKDLQKQLARVLYEARYSLRAELFSSAAALGKHLRSLSYDASSRFREFAENTLLLGQIAAALLVQEPGDEQLISANTLERLIADINEERASREWLREARSSAQRLRVRGLSTRGTSTPTPAAGVAAIPTSKDQKDPAAQLRAMGLEPRFLVRPAANGAWEVVLEVPDLAPILRQHPHLRDTLAQSPGRVTGAASRVIARGRLVQGGVQRFVLNSWPGPEQPLITFDAAKAGLRLFLDSVFRTPPGDSWLFRIGSDGQAHDLKSRVVHPGGTYILLQRQPVGTPIKGFNKLALTCDGVNALQFEVPPKVDELWETLLSNLKLQCSKTLRVWPAGLSPASWDEVGHGEWLISDEVILGVEVDHSVQSLEITLDGQPAQSCRVSTGPQGGRLFLSLGCPAEGTHRATISTSRASGKSDELRGFLDFRVRAPQAAGAGRSAQQALLLSTFPTAPALEDLWDGRLELQLGGPTGTRVACTISLRERGSDRALFTKSVPAQTLPIEPATWRAVFQNHFRKEKNAELSYDAAYQCRVDFDAGSIGRAVLVAEREFTPLRWGVQSAGETAIARLFDDSGATEVAVALREFGAPTSARALEYESVIKGLPVGFPGGLLVASAPGKSASAIVVPPRNHLHLADLSISPVVPPARRDSHSLAGLLRVASEWETARQKGSALGPPYLQCVLTTIMAAVLEAVAGEKWGRAERRYTEDQSLGLREMKTLISDSPAERSLGGAIAHDVERLAKEDASGKVVHFARLACTYLQGLKADSELHKSKSFVATFAQRAEKEEHGRDLCEFALRAVSSPTSLLSWCGANLEPGLNALLQRPALARAARFAVLAVDQVVRSSDVVTSTTYAGWNW